SSLGYGSMGTATAYGPADDTESTAAIRRAFDLGVTHFDTAEMYGWGAGEELLGAAVHPFRDDITIATKFGLTPEGG
ncbi:aldo/keto reductase, partial [Bacillus sp. S34]|nr:aldo/keto reductase [Bacillus sp. S34]